MVGCGTEIWISCGFTASASVYKRQNQHINYEQENRLVRLSVGMTKASTGVPLNILNKQKTNIRRYKY